jgi:hypothetical protein
MHFDLRFGKLRIAFVILPVPVLIAQFLKSVYVSGRRFGPGIEIHARTAAWKLVLGHKTWGKRQERTAPNPFPRDQRPTLLFAFCCGFVVKALYDWFIGVENIGRVNRSYQSY